MARRSPPDLSRRERQILEILYRLGRASAADVVANMADAPTCTTVRGLLRILERKGHVRHDEEGLRYIYSPVTTRATAGVSALSHVIRTFFANSPSDAMAALLGSSSNLSKEELERLMKLVRKGRRES
jgi:BlaI family transcriptional regulator, penicillinase repressor